MVEQIEKIHTQADLLFSSSLVYRPFLTPATVRAKLEDLLSQKNPNSNDFGAACEDYVTLALQQLHTENVIISYAQSRQHSHLDHLGVDIVGSPDIFIQVKARPAAALLKTQKYKQYSILTVSALDWNGKPVPIELLATTIEISTQDNSGAYDYFWSHIPGHY